MGYERLSAQDTAFLHLEREGQPMHVGSLGYLEGGPLVDDRGRFRLDDVRRRIGSRLHLVPRLRKRLSWVPLDQGRPVWVDAAGFDIDHHVRLAALPRPGDEAQFLDLMGRLQAVPLDRDRPLWEIWFVEGVEGGRIGVIQKTHHCLVDGVSGVEMATVMLDLEADAPTVLGPRWEPEPEPEATTLLVDTLAERAADLAGTARSLREALRHPELVAERINQVAQSLVDAGDRPPPTPFGVAVGPRRRFATARVPLETAKAVRAHVAGPVTVNDVVLAGCTGALRRFLLHRGIEVADDLELRAMVPVSLRSDEDRLTLGNRVSTMIAVLPVGIEDPVEQLLTVHHHMADRKTSGQVADTQVAMTIGDLAPPPLLRLGVKLAVRALPVNLVVTNVAGPPVPLYCAGGRVLEAFPYVGVVDGLALVIAVLSYDGQLAFGVIADADAVPDVGVIAAGIEDALTALRDAVEVAPHEETARPA